MNFCAECGQETALHPPTLAEFLHEFIGHYVALEGALWRTLGLLLLRPGRLTREYLAGRKRRYVLPLRLYLTASFVFFLCLKLLPSVANQAVVFDDGDLPSASASASAASGADAPAAASAPRRGLRLRKDRGPFEVDCDTPDVGACGLGTRIARRVAERMGSDPAAAAEQVRTRLLGVAPYAVFLLLPVFAGIVALVYRRRGMTYGEHVVFSLHLHAFWFLALLAVALLPKAASDVAVLLLPLYGAWALHVVYRGRWLPTLLRAALVSLLYGTVLLLATAGLVLGLLLI